MVYLKVKENSQQAKLILAYLQTLPFIEVIEKENLPNEITLKAIKAAKEGKVTKTQNVQDFFNKLNK